MLRLLLILLLLSTQVAEAANKRTYGMRPRVYEKVQLIQQQLDGKQYREAIAAIEELQQNSLSEYELAQTWDIKGITHYQLNELTPAIKSYEKVIEQKEAIPEGMYMRSLKTLAQLNMMKEDYPASLRHAHTLLALEPDASMHMLVAQAHYRQDNFEPALDACLKARDMYNAKQKPLKENWLQLQNAIHHALNDYPSMLVVLEEMLVHYPKTEYLKYMASVYGELEDMNKQTGILETLHEQGELKTSSELLNLASLYQIQKTPFKSGQMLEKQLKLGKIEENERVLNMLVSAWTLAKNDHKAMLALEKLTQLTGNSNDYIRLAYHYFDNKDWQKTVTTVSTAMQGETVKDPGNAMILQGMAQMKLKRFDEAGESFVLASRHQNVKKLAAQWLRFSEKEQQKYAELASLGITLPLREL